MSEKKAFEPTICIDFDGTAHLYSKGWKDGSCYDHYVPGLFTWLKTICEHEEPRFKLVIYSSRSATPEGKSAMLQWFGRESVRAVEEGELSGDFEFPIIFDRLEFANVKPPAWLTIDDRCVRFRGNWSAPDLQPQSLLDFKPWNSPTRMQMSTYDEAVEALEKHVAEIKAEGKPLVCVSVKTMENIIASLKSELHR